MALLMFSLMENRRVPVRYFYLSIGFLWLLASFWVVTPHHHLGRPSTQDVQGCTICYLGAAFSPLSGTEPEWNAIPLPFTLFVHDAAEIPTANGVLSLSSTRAPPSV